MWFNTFARPILRSPLHSIMSNSVLLVNYTGHKSGKSYSVPVNYVHDGADLLILSNRDRVWWRSLRAERACSITLKRQELNTTATVYDDDQAVATQMAVYMKAAPQTAKYLKIPMHNGEPDPDTLATLAPEHVVIRISPAD